MKSTKLVAVLGSLAAAALLVLAVAPAGGCAGLDGITPDCTSPEAGCGVVFTDGSSPGDVTVSDALLPGPDSAADTAQPDGALDSSSDAQGGGDAHSDAGDAKADVHDAKVG